MKLSRTKLFVLCTLIFCIFVFSRSASRHATYNIPSKPSPPIFNTDESRWANVRHRYPVVSFRPVPTSAAQSLPRIQHDFGNERVTERRVRLARLSEVKGNFTHAWNGYKKHAWLRDEVRPISGGAHNPFGGWAATLVDSLDTLWIMEMYDDFKEAVEAIKEINFSTCALQQLNVFETTIRYLGGFLSAYDLSEGKYPILLQKATEMGDMLYKAFDTPNHMPITRWNFKAALEEVVQEAGDSVLLSEIGSLSLEFTRLSQLSGDPRYYDAIQRVMDVFERQQDKTKLPGMWPIVINAKTGDHTGYHGFTIGGMADSMYEYLPKQYMLLGGAMQQYRRLYEYAIIAIKRNIFYRPMTLDNEDIRLAGHVDSDGNTPLSKLKTLPEAQHLGCFAGGMVAIAAKTFQNEEDLSLAKKLVEGCLWGYEVMPLGIMPEVMHVVPCENDNDCQWDQKRWYDLVNAEFAGPEAVEFKIQQNHLRPGVVKVEDSRYILRPEAIESIFILYRITGDATLRDRAWKIFNAIIRHTKTDFAHAALDDCTVDSPPKADRMESFWLAETLKYFYLLFSEPEVVSLDEWVLNTEAHPFRRPVVKGV